MVGIAHAARPSDDISHHRIFLLQLGKLLLGLPIPDTVTREQDVNLFERALVRLWVECPDDDNRKDVDATEDVQCLLIQAGEDCWEQQHLCHCQPC